MDDCTHKRTTIESPTEARIRWEKGEDNRWFQKTCRDCGALWFTPSDRQFEEKLDEGWDFHSN